MRLEIFVKNAIAPIIRRFASPGDLLDFMMYTGIDSEFEVNIDITKLRLHGIVEEPTSEYWSNFVTSKTSVQFTSYGALVKFLELEKVDKYKCVYLMNEKRKSFWEALKYRVVMLSECTSELDYLQLVLDESVKDGEIPEYLREYVILDSIKTQLPYKFESTPFGTFKLLDDEKHDDSEDEYEKDDEDDEYDAEPDEPDEDDEPEEPDEYEEDEQEPEEPVRRQDEDDGAWYIT